MPLTVEEVARIVAVVRAGGRSPQEAAVVLSLTEEQILAIEAAHPTAWQRWLINDARHRLRVEVGDTATALARVEQLPRRRQRRPCVPGATDEAKEGDHG